MTVSEERTKIPEPNKKTDAAPPPKPKRKVGPRTKRAPIEVAMHNLANAERQMRQAGKALCVASKMDRVPELQKLVDAVETFKASLVTPAAV